ncbi:alginate O-acetyltransferase [Deinococcus malanensis]|uniref:Alginate biosynthesis protein AlgF n=1 Tax=Deinococcus malanensis TaxID=1706855 RepID=A0ABQ2EZX6_9DEIO|nr:alginate O-acetyltransferase [Deinococcus malanensis]
MYAPEPPADSAYVRIVNVTGALATARIGNKSYSVKNAASSPYLVIPQGSPKLSAGRTSQTLNVAAGHYYTVALTGTASAPKIVVFDDPTNTNRAKALIVLYNLSSRPGVNLKTADGKTAVIPGVVASRLGSRAVNGIKISLAAFQGTRPLATFKDVQLERSAAYSVVVTNKGAFWTRSTTSTR